MDSREVDAALKQLIRRVEDATPAMDSVGQTIVDHVAGNFSGEHDPSGTRWAELEESTKRARKGTSEQILKDSGILANSITHNPTRDSVEAGTREPYGKFHQSGTKHMPARPFMPIEPSKAPPDLIEEILDDLLHHIAKT